MTMGKRIAQARKSAGMSQQAVANNFGISRAAVAQWESGDTRPETGKLDRLSQVLDVRLEWLGTGREPMRHDDPELPAGAGRFLVPVIDDVRAGAWSEVTDPYAPGAGVEFLATDLKIGVHAFALIIDGDSMTPEYRPGDKVIVDPGVVPRPGDCVVAKLDREQTATFKKYRPRGVDRSGNEVFELVPLNENWPTLHVDAENPGRIIATMVEHRRYRHA